MKYREFRNLLRSVIKEVVETKQRTIYVLIGPPAIGKSTWIKKTFKEKKPYIINRDDIVEKVAESYGWTYDDMFAAPPQNKEEIDKASKDKNFKEILNKFGKIVDSPSYMTWQPFSFSKVVEANNEVFSKFQQRVSNAHPSGKDIVIDMTNMNVNSRKGALKAIENNEQDYKKVAVVFSFKGNEELVQRIAAKRSEIAKSMGKNKTIPKSAIERMMSSYQEVSDSEGFDEVISVDNVSALKKFVEEQAKKNFRKKSLDEFSTTASIAGVTTPLGTDATYPAKRKKKQKRLNKATMKENRSILKEEKHLNDSEELLNKLNDHVKWIRMPKTYPHSRIDMEGADLSGIRLTNKYCSGIRLINCNLRNADLSNSSFDSADFTGSDLTGAKLSNSNFEYSVLNDVKLNDADCSKVKFENAKIQNTQLNNTFCMDTNFTNVDFSNSDFNNIQLNNSVLYKAQFENTKGIKVSGPLTGLGFSMIGVYTTEGVKVQVGDFWGTPEEARRDYIEWFRKDRRSPEDPIYKRYERAWETVITVEPGVNQHDIEQRQSYTYDRKVSYGGQNRNPYY